MSSVKKQIEILIKKGLTISSKKTAKAILLKENYYNVINGYKDCFLDAAYVPSLPTDPNEKFLPGTTFEQVYSLFVFDRNIRNLFLKYFLIVENQFKSHMAYIFARVHGEDGYLNVDNFETSNEKAFYVYSLEKQINSVIEKNKKDDRIAHFCYNNNNKIPIWALVSLFDVGTTRTFFRNCDNSVTPKICYYYGITTSQMNSFWSSINMFRNVCAHDDRLYCYRINDNDKQIKDTNVHANLRINTTTYTDPISGATLTKYIYGKKDLFSIIIVFKYMLTDEDFSLFFNELNAHLNALSGAITIPEYNKVIDLMGFPLADPLTGQCPWTNILTVAK